MADQDQEQTPTPTPPPKESPFPKPAPGLGDPHRSARITAPPEAGGSAVSALNDPRRSSRITAPPEATSGAPLANDPRRSSRITAPPEAVAGNDPRRSARITAPAESVTAQTAAPAPGFASAASGDLPKTIRVVRPPLPTPGVAMPPPRPGGNPLPPGPKPLSEPLVQAAKSKTSRISLEAAIGVDHAPGKTTHVPLAPAGVDGAPKTIRLKRPSEMPTLKVPVVHPGSASPVLPPSPRATTSIRSTTPIVPHSTPSKTSKLPEPEVLSDAAPEAIPLTQKRTIRVRRPGSVAASEAAAASGDGDVAMTPIPQEESLRPLADTCNPLFLIAAAVTLVVTGVLIAVFYQQLYGMAALY